MGLPSPQSHDAAPLLLDPSAIDGLAQIMAQDALHELLADMLVDVEQRLCRIAEPRSLRQTQQDAHDLKSMGGNFGLLALSACAAGVERDARRGADEDVRAAVPALLEAGRASIAALSERYTVTTGGNE